MKIIGLKKYRHGYTGFLEHRDRYEYFQFGRERYRTLQEFAKSDYENFDHFVSVIRIFGHASIFTEKPIEVDGLDNSSLQRVLIEAFGSRDSHGG